jgi:hypothetical protein
MFIFYDSHTLSLHIEATSLKRHLKKKIASTGIWTQTSHTVNERVTPAQRGSYTHRHEYRTWEEKYDHIDNKKPHLKCVKNQKKT